MEEAVMITRGPQDASAAINRILSDHQFREELSQRALAYARRFSWESIAIQHKQLYEQLLTSE
jgi:glycosyltransferase involved in cell wall biosynthesis